MMIKKTIVGMSVGAVLMLSACTGSCPSPEKAKESLKSIMPPQFEIKAVQSAPVSGLCEVDVSIDKQPPIVIYIDTKGKNLFSGSIVEIASKRNLTAERSQMVRK